MGGPKITKVQGESQATPLAEDFLKLLEGQLAEGSFGTGVGPLQREAGTAIRQFITSLQGQGGGPSEGLSRLIEGVEAGSKRRTEEGALNQREAFGITGSRFGTSLALGEGRLRAEAGEGLDRTIGGLLEQGRQFDTTALFQAIQQLFGQGEANIAPFRQFAGLGILPEEIIASPGFLDQLLSGAISGAAAFAGRPPGAGGGGTSGTAGGAGGST